MVKKTEQNLEVTKSISLKEMREKEVVDQRQPSYQTDPIARKLLDFSLSNKTRRFSVKDLFKR